MKLSVNINSQTVRIFRCYCHLFCLSWELTASEEFQFETSCGWASPVTYLRGGGGEPLEGDYSCLQCSASLPTPPPVNMNKTTLYSRADPWLQIHLFRLTKPIVCHKGSLYLKHIPWLEQCAWYNTLGKGWFGHVQAKVIRRGSVLRAELSFN